MADDLPRPGATRGDVVAGLARAAHVLASDTDLDGLLHTACDVARHVTGARYAAIGVIGPDQHLERFLHSGLDEATAARIGPLPTGGGVLGLLVRDPRLLRLDDVAEHPASSGFPPHHPPMRSFLGVPLRSGGEVFGNLYLTERAGGFTAEDERVVVVLAAQVGAAVAALRLRQRLSATAVQHERDRIARDLHDHAVQQLFATGMRVEAQLARLGPDAAEVRDELDAVVTSLHSVIADLRRLMQELDRPMDTDAPLSAQLVALARAHEAATGVRPSLHMDLPPGVPPPESRAELVAVVREALGNVARHAAATIVLLTAHVRDGRVVVEVVDDGRGFVPADDHVGRGLANVQERAARLGGGVEVSSAPGSGTTLRLTVPIGASP